MIRPAVQPMDALFGLNKPVLDHGFVRLIDYMGNDAAIVQAARVSYGDGTKSLREDRGLINYLWRNRHTSPFEMCEIKLHVKMPIFVARQWVRHRTANINEYSGRYSIMDNDYYLPQAFKAQDDQNRQGSSGDLDHDLTRKMRQEVTQQCDAAFVKYKEMIAEGCSRELARIILPVNFYTQWYWKIDLHNLLHFLTLRCDKHAQAEIRAYADVIAAIVEDWVPITHAAWRVS